MNRLPRHEYQVLSALAADRAVPVDELVSATGLDQSLVSAAANALAGRGLVTVSEDARDEYIITDAGRDAARDGFPEKRALAAIKEAGGSVSFQQLPKLLGSEDVRSEIKWLTRKGWCTRDSGLLAVSENGEAALSESGPDETFIAVLAERGKAFPEDIGDVDTAAALRLLKGRSELFRSKRRTTRSLALTDAGKKLRDEGIEPAQEASQLTQQMIVSGDWRNVVFKNYDPGLEAATLYPGKPHPMRRVIQETRRAFLEMGFEEVSSPAVDTAFWVFDALFQPQDHPAREMQDTFYVGRPGRGKLPADELVERIARTHEDGGDTGSTGWRYKWERSKAEQLVLRTHTTASTIRALAENPNPPRKVFSIGRTFRRENVDQTHLPEFVQIDGIIIDEKASFANLLGTLAEFYLKMGADDVRFRPSFFPYTEPSAEVFVKMGELGWVEMCGAGVFRPEVTRPLGCNVPVLAWGGGVERIAMMRFGLDDIRKLYWSDIDWLKGAALCRYVGIPVARLQQLVGRDLDGDELRQALENLGNDVEGYASVTRYRCDRCGHLTEALEHEDFNNACGGCGSDAALVDIGTSEVIRIDLLPVRPDMFDAAGLARALRGYFGIETGLPVFEPGSSGYSVKVAPGLEDIRPFIVGAVVRGLAMDNEMVRILMKMQENLHWALGRDRRRASIGVYDLATVEPGFEFRPVGPTELKFVPLLSHLMAPAPGAQSGLPGESVSATPQEILEKHPKGIDYAHLLAGKPAYPLLVDAKGAVLSMPPIINSDTTRVTADTRELFIDVTGPDRNAIAKSLNVLVAAMADLGGKLETVEVRYPDGTVERTPDLSPTAVDFDPASANRVLGLEVTTDEMAGLLEKLRYGARVDGERIAVEVPPYRADILHEYDIIEDVAIGYGYSNIVPSLVPTMTVGRPQPIEELSEAARRVMTGFGLLEVMTLALSNPREQFELRRMSEAPFVEIGNPASVEQTMTRVSLIPGLLTTFRENSTREMPQSIFEIGDCFALDPGAETGVKTMRRLAVGLAGPRVGFADGRALAVALARELGFEVFFAAAIQGQFIDGRCATVSFERDGDGIEWGVLGEVHPEALANFNINQPATVFEVSLDVVR